MKRRNCLGVRERIDAQGEVVVPLTDDTLAALKTDIEARLQIRQLKRLPSVYSFRTSTPPMN